MQDDAGEEKVGKGAFGADVAEVGLVLRVALDAQTGGEDEGSHAGDETREERVEGKRADEAAVEELDDARDEDVTHVGVDQFEFGRRPRGVIFEEPLDDADHAALLRHNDDDARGMDGWMVVPLFSTENHSV